MISKGEHCCLLLPLNLLLADQEDLLSLTESGLRLMNQDALFQSCILCLVVRGCK